MAFLKQSSETVCACKFEFEWIIREYIPEPMISEDFRHPYFPEETWFLRLEPPASAYMLSEGTITLVPKGVNTSKIAVQIDYNDTCLLRTMFEPARQAIRASFRVEGSEKMIATTLTVKCFLCYPSKLCPDVLSSTLERDVTRLLSDPALRRLSPDFELVSCDAGSVTVHRLLLAARSPVFKTLLAMDSQESRAGSMHLHDTSAATLHLLSQFLYDDQVRLPDLRQAIDLFLFADEYDFQRLKLETESFISCNIRDASGARLALQLTANVPSAAISKAASSFLDAT